MIRHRINNEVYILPAYENRGSRRRYTDGLVPTGCPLHPDCFSCTETDCRFDSGKVRSRRVCHG